MTEKKKLYICTGPIKSGKSSRLLSFIQNRKDVGGILSPVFDMKKYLYDIQTNEKKLLEAESGEKKENIIEVGNYIFKKDVFCWAREILKKTITQKNFMLIIDEIGPLELSGKGLAPVSTEIIGSYSTSSSKIVIVVREPLLSRFLETYEIRISEIEYFYPF